MFTRLVKHLSTGDELTFQYSAAGYGPNENGVPAEKIEGDITAILDYRFTATSKLSWYFDHHVSGFATDDDRLYYREQIEPFMGLGSHERRQMFHDGAYTSCTKLIADIGKDEFGLEVAPMGELVHWADMIDSAAFPTAEMAVERREPVLQLMTVVEQFGNTAFLKDMVPLLSERPLIEVATSKEVAEKFLPIHAAHQTFVDLVKQKAEKIGNCVYVDMSAESLDVAPKFVTYALYPESAYSVVLTATPQKCKISVGYNPWSKTPRKHNIAAICERSGGGGHPVVGAISLRANEVERARTLARSIAVELDR